MFSFGQIHISAADAARFISQERRRDQPCWFGSPMKNLVEIDPKEMMIQKGLTLWLWLT